MADCGEFEGPCCSRREQRIVKLGVAGQEFHGFSTSEILDLLGGLTQMSSEMAGPDAVRYTPGNIADFLTRNMPDGGGLDDASGGLG